MANTEKKTAGGIPCVGDGNERTSHPILMCSVVILEVAFAPEFIRYTLGVYAFLVAAFCFYIKAPAGPPCTLPKNFHGVKSYPFLGHSFKLIEVYETLQDWALITAEACGWKEFHIRLLRFGHFKNGALVLISPESVKHVLKDNFENYVKGDAFYSTLNEFLGDGIFASDGPTWKLHRKVATGMFSKKLLRNGTEAAMTQAKKLIAKIDDYAARGEAFDIQKMFYNFTMDVFSLIAFGVDLDSQNQPHEFANAFDRVQQTSDGRMMNPFWKIRRAFKWFSLKRQSCLLTAPSCTRLQKK